MKTLKKIHLRSVTESLSDQEMRYVVGGYAGYSECGHCYYNVTFSDGTTLNGDGVFCGSSGCQGYDCYWSAAEAWMVDQVNAFGCYIKEKSWACSGTI